jgi:hypothetical protein
MSWQNIAKDGLEHGMTSSDFETEAMRPVSVQCDDTFLYITLADSRQIRAPLWWYPFLYKAKPSQRAKAELEFAGIWWPDLDDGISVKAVLLGWKAPGATEPQRAA